MKEKKLVIKNLSIKSEDKIILNGANLVANSNEITTILGKSGTGKSLVFNFLLNLRAKNLKFSFDSKIDLNLYPIFQNPQNCLNPLFSIKNFFKELGVSKDELYKALNKFSLDKKILNFRPNELSGGMMQRILLIGALLCKKDFIIADEPNANLDSKNKEIVKDMFLKLRKKGVLLITHDLDLAMISDKIYLLQNSNLVLIKKDDFRKNRFINLLFKIRDNG